MAEGAPADYGLTGRKTISPSVSEKERPSTTTVEAPLTNVLSPLSPGVPSTPLPFARTNSLDLDDYFVGPRDLAKHSKWPLFMRLHGSILPKMIVPLLFMGAWASVITWVSITKHSLEVESVLLTITGFVVSMGLSLRSSTAYERYAEGRRLWSMATMASHALGRVFWVHCKDRPELDPKESMLRKISAMNLVVAFAVSLKHMLRFEPYTSYPDMQHLVAHLDTLAKEATAASEVPVPRKNIFKATGEYLGLSFAESNPRKALKKAQLPLGNLPLEILNHLAMTVDHMIEGEQLPIPMQQTLAYNNLAMLNDVLNNCERVLSTPLPIAYSIAISQITWVYVILLPFQLIKPLGWVAIPATVAASYIILGLLLIGNEIENPFGHDVNDLPLESYCEQIAHDMDVIATCDTTRSSGFMLRPANQPLYPVSTASVSTWMARSEDKLREAIRAKPKATFDWRRSKDPGAGTKSADHMA